MPKYPIYIPSRGRAHTNLTANLLVKENIPFYLVVENKEYELYASKYGVDKVLNLNGSDFGDVAFARNFIKDHSTALGHARHWQIDDDIAGMMSVKDRVTLSENTDEILSGAEFFVDQYRNIALAGFSSSVFGKLATKPYAVNRFAYTCMLIENGNPFRYTKGTEEDLDYNLQVLTSGLCTLQFSMFLFKWSTTGTRAGGYTDLNAQGKRLNRQTATMAKWPKLLSKIVEKGDGHRIVTNTVWKNFTQPLVRK